MSFMAAAVWMGAEGLGAAMLAGGMMGGTMGAVGNLIQGKDAFSNLGQNMLMGAGTAGLVSGVGSLAGGVGTTTTSTIAGDMATPSYSEWERTQALLDAAPTASSIPNTIAPIGTPTPPAALELTDNGYRNAGDYNADATSEIPLAPNPPTTSTAGSPPDLKANPTTGMLPNNTTTTTRPPAEFMKNPADYMVQNPSKVAAIGSGLTSLLNPRQPGIANPLTDKTGYSPKFTWDQKTQKYVSAAPAPYTYKGAEGGEIRGYKAGGPYKEVTPGPYKEGVSGPIYGEDTSLSSKKGPYEDTDMYSSIKSKIERMSPSMLDRLSKGAKDPIVQAAATTELYDRSNSVNSYISQPTTQAAKGGIMSLDNSYAAGGKLLQGPGDGMSDSIPAVIQGAKPQRAALAQGEFVIPADVVSHLGNGSTDAGAKRLYAMMDKIRHARTGNKKQGKQINPNNFLPA